MTVVFDASAVIYVCATPDGAGRIADLDAHAPALMWSEYTATLGQQRWRSEIDAALVEPLLEALDDSRVSRHNSRELYRAAVDVAIRLGWAKTYDAEYVALAEMLDAPLVTRDARLHRSASRLVTVLSPDEVLK